jgi:uncharacterized Zn-binding protein involved in type VI secretion
MAVTIHVNGKSNSLAHKGGMGFTKSTLPDVCKTPSPGGPMPIPYPVIVSMSNSLKKGSKNVKVDGGNSAAIKGSEFSRCNGDEPGTVGGVKSSTNMKEATWILYSFDVKIEGKNACRLADKMMMNHGNTACLAGHITKPVGLSPADSALWDECKDQHDKYKAMQEEQANMVDAEYNALHQRVHGGGSLQDRIDYCERLERRIEVVKRLHRERKKYIDMGCDKFDWTNSGTTQAEREAAHGGELDNVSASLKNLYELLKRFKP